jgi:hypothetical protein
LRLHSNTLPQKKQNDNKNHKRNKNKTTKKGKTIVSILQDSFFFSALGLELMAPHLLAAAITTQATPPVLSCDGFFPDRIS